MPTWRASDGRGRPLGDGRRRPEGRGPGLPGLLKFALFSGILAVVVLLALLTALRPLVRMVVVGWAWDTPSAFHIPFVADLVREDLGAQLSQPGGTDAREQAFDVLVGDTPQTLVVRLVAGGFVAHDRAFLFAAIESGLADKLKAGAFLIRRDMTPAQLVSALVNARVVITTMDVTFREGLRLEQITAKLQTVTSGVDAQAFYDIVTKPPPSLLADYPWLALPEGATLEGFLYPATYKLVTGTNGGPTRVTTAEDLVRMMLNAFYARVGADRLAVPATRGLTFYQVVVLASIVEQEALLDSERPLIAGVYQNRLNPKLFPRLTLESDPTVIYVNDTLKLKALPFDQWQLYLFWAQFSGPLPTDLPKALAGYDTYHSPGLPPGPICSPTVASIDAALAPDAGTGFLYFIAKGDGTGTTAFAKTYAEHLRNVAKYGH